MLARLGVRSSTMCRPYPSLTLTLEVSMKAKSESWQQAQQNAHESRDWPSGTSTDAWRSSLKNKGVFQRSFSIAITFLLVHIKARFTPHYTSPTHTTTC